MFKILSRRKYESLIHKRIELFEEVFQQRSDELLYREAACSKTEEANEFLKQRVERLRSERDEYKRGYEKYKGLYLDELQKRLGLAETVRALEQKQP